MTEPGKALGHLKRAVTARPTPQPAKHTVTLIPGDTIGEEVAEAVTLVVAATGTSLQWDRQTAGQGAMGKFGTPLPQPTLDSIRQHRVALKGRLAAPAGQGPQGGGAESPNVALRKALGLFASVRPARNLPGLKSRYEGIDLVVIRENTEDVYAGIEHEVVPGVVQSLKVVTEAASTRIARFAFEHAAQHDRRSVAAVHKANIMKMSDGLFLKCCRDVARQYPAIDYREIIADACLMQLVLNPYQFDVLVMGNLLGDIVSDLCAGLAGGPGTVPGINVGPDAVVFEAIHGHAPHLEGQDLANPLTLLVPAVAMLNHIGEGDAARRILGGIERVLTAGSALTPDLGGRAHTSEMARAIAESLPA